MCLCEKKHVLLGIIYLFLILAQLPFQIAGYR